MRTARCTSLLGLVAIVGCLRLDFVTELAVPEQLSLGAAHSCAIKQDGSLWCWGKNDVLQLGIESDAAFVETPTQVGQDVDWEQVSAGEDHTCARRTDGSLWCWGSNVDGKLGAGPTSGSAAVLPPTRVLSDQRWASFCAGVRATLAVSEDGELFGWGRIGLTSKPERLDDEGRWSKVTCAVTPNYGEVGCAIRDDTTLWCWMIDVEFAPVQEGAEAGWTAIDRGGTHGCGMVDGSPWCWGLNNYEQLGVSVELSPAPPTLVDDGRWLAVAAGAAHSCLVRGDGSLWCAGLNTSGQLGNGSRDNHPLEALGVWTDWQAVAAGGYHTCGRRSDGSLWCWGANDQGQLGVSTEGLDALDPTQVW